MEIKFILAIPARLESSRLPNKVLEDIGGKPMLLRVLEQCSKKFDKNKIVLCTDSDKIIKLADKTWKFPYIKTEKKCDSGSSRIASVINKLVKMAWNLNTKNLQTDINDLYKKTLVINVQGDQPFLNPEIILEMIKVCSKSNLIPEIITPIYRLSKENIHNPAVVKTLISNNDNVIYFSRSALPHVRGKVLEEWYKYAQYWGHVGIYGYRADILKSWDKLPASKLEDSEKLEQLRLIDAGYNIKTFKIDEDSLSIDTIEQLEHARKICKNNVYKFPKK